MEYDDHELEGQIKSRLEFIIKEVCHYKLNTKHYYLYEDLDKGLFLELSPTDVKYQMKLRIRNLKENNNSFDEYFLKFDINS